MYLGIEIGDKNLRMGVGEGLSPQLAVLKRMDVDQDQAALRILEQLETQVRILLQKYPIKTIGIGLGGLAEVGTGFAAENQIAGWDKFPLAQWFEKQFDIPTVTDDDCSCATLAEAICGAGKDRRAVFYVGVGRNIIGGFAIDGQLLGSDQLGGVRKSVAEIGKLRPGPHADRAEMTVDSIASGTGIVNSVRARISGMVAGSVESIRLPEPFAKEELKLRLSNANQTEKEFVNDLLARCDDDLAGLDARTVAQAALDGNEIACWAIDHGVATLGWAIAQMITLLAPDVVVIGGGVSMMGQGLFWEPLRSAVDKHVFPPLRGSFQLLLSELGQETVVQGAIIRAMQSHQQNTSR